MERIYEIAKQLTALPGVSGDEQRALGRVRELLGGYFDETFLTPVSSFLGVPSSFSPSSNKPFAARIFCNSPSCLSDSVSSVHRGAAEPVNVKSAGFTPGLYNVTVWFNDALIFFVARTTTSR